MAITTNSLQALLQQYAAQGGTDQNAFLTQLLGSGGISDTLRQQVSDMIQQQKDVTGTVGGALPNTPSAVNVAPVTAPGAVPVSGNTAASMDWNQGLDPATRAALTTQSLQSQATGFSDANAAVRAELARRGILTSGVPGSGLATDPLTQLAVQKAMAGSNAITNTALKNQEQLNFNRANLILPGQISENQMNLTSGLAGNAAALQAALENQRTSLTSQQTNATNMLTGNDQELARRQLLLSALAGGANIINAGTNVGNMLTAGYGTSSGNQRDAAGNLVTSKGNALNNDAQTGIGSYIKPLIAAGAGAVGGALTGGMAGAAKGVSGALTGKP